MNNSSHQRNESSFLMRSAGENIVSNSLSSLYGNSFPAYPNMRDSARNYELNVSPFQKLGPPNQINYPHHYTNNHNEMVNNSSYMLQKTLKNFPNYSNNMNMSSIQANSSNMSGGNGGNYSTIFNQSGLDNSYPSFYPPNNQSGFMNESHYNNHREQYLDYLPSYGFNASAILPFPSPEYTRDYIKNGFHDIDPKDRIERIDRFVNLSKLGKRKVEEFVNMPREQLKKELKIRIQEFHEQIRKYNTYSSGYTDFKVIYDLVNYLIAELGRGIFYEFHDYMIQAYPGRVVPSPIEMRQQHEMGYYDPLLIDYLMFKDIDEEEHRRRMRHKHRLGGKKKKGPLNLQEINQVSQKINAGEPLDDILNEEGPQEDANDEPRFGSRREFEPREEFDQVRDVQQRRGVDNNNRLAPTFEKHKQDDNSSVKSDNSGASNSAKRKNKQGDKGNKKKSEFGQKGKFRMKLKSSTRVVLLVIRFSCALHYRTKEKFRMISSPGFLNKWNSKFHFEYLKAEEAGVEFFKALDSVIIPLLNDKRNMIICSEVEKKAIKKQEMQKRAEIVKDYVSKIAKSLVELRLFPTEINLFLYYLVYSGSFAADDFFHNFELKRLSFTKYRCLKKVDSKRAYMLTVTLVVFRIFIFNYLLQYPTVLQIAQNDLTSRNLRSVCSIFYEIFKRDIEKTVPNTENQENIPIDLRITPAEISPLKDSLKFDIITKSGKDEVIEGLYPNDGVDLILLDQKWTNEIFNSLKSWIYDSFMKKFTPDKFFFIQDILLKERS